MDPYVQFTAYLNGESAEVVGLEWDEGNWPKCGRNGVSRTEIEQTFINGPPFYARPGHSIDEQRLRAIGRHDEGRAIDVFFTVRHKSLPRRQS